MTRKEAINQLEDLIIDRKSFIDESTEADSPFRKDIIALEIAVKMLRSKVKVRTHGHWMVHGVRYFTATCSVCEHTTSETTPYCPYCSSIMDGATTNVDDNSTNSSGNEERSI